jgi:hypothetical protein
MNTRFQDSGLVAISRPQCRCVTPESSTLLHTMRSKEGDACGKEEADTVEDRHRHADQTHANTARAHSYLKLKRRSQKVERAFSRNTGSMM